MSDQQPPAERDTAAVAGPIEAPGTAEGTPQDVDWQKRYNDLQPEYTRTSQEAAELRQWRQWAEVALTSEDPDTRRQAIEALGYELPDDEQQEEELTPAEYDDPYDELTARQQAIEQRLNQNDEAARHADEAALIRAITDERLAGLEGLSPEDHDMVLAYAINALPPVREPGLPVPLPDVQGAFEYFQQREVERQKQWARTKRAPAFMPGGVAANEASVLAPDATHEQRVRWAAQLHQSAAEAE